ncbi:MAG: plasmid pRiA4b ORF-3 family protein [Candidatus Thermoplasmatota archaeon]|nr:plasmid pRiA4b ORF-3 family protein [Candidatus Thermoplasmatota archaeon]
MKKKFEYVYQFKITLLETDPPIWRRIQVPGNYSFWDLHVAIQDSMGWEDCHMHEFRLPFDDVEEPIHIGIPTDDDEMMGIITLPEHKERISDRFKKDSSKALYVYDFGDDWDHEVMLEGVLLREKGMEYPACLSGERACPPEDCGGVFGYSDIIRVLKKRSKNADDKELLEWIGDYDPEQFDPKEVLFDDPKQRFRMAFSRR